MRDVFEQHQQLLNIHLQHIGDGFLLELHFQRLAAESLAFADGASNPHVGEKVHFQPRTAVSFAGFAAPAFDVETETARLVAAALRLRQLAEEIADFVEDLNVSARVAARRAADWRLVDGNQLVEMLQAFDRPVSAGGSFALVQIAVQGLDDNVADERAFAAAADARDADELAQRDFDVDVLQVVVRRTQDFQKVAISLAALVRDLDLLFTRQEFAGEAVF